MKAKKRSKKRRERSPNQSRDQGGQAAKPDLQDDDGRMDFGGLPQRDLKKNLGGCG